MKNYKRKKTPKDTYIVIQFIAIFGTIHKHPSKLFNILFSQNIFFK